MLLCTILISSVFIFTSIAVAAAVVVVSIFASSGFSSAFCVNSFY